MRLKPARIVARALPPLAILVFALTLGWWWRTFGEVVGYGYLSWREAGRCLLSDNDICSLAKALCLSSHPRLLLAYGSAAFWVALAVLSLACLVAFDRRGGGRNIAPSYPSTEARG
jgi:hypothetical protein